MKKIFILILWFALSFLASPGQAKILDAPHNQANGIGCSSCHTYSAWWQYSPANRNAAAFETVVNTICLSCHDSGGNAPVMPVHGSATLGEQHGVWSTGCTECHDPHFQAQIDWLGSHSGDLFLVTGTITVIDNGNSTFSYAATDNGDNTTTLTIDANATQAASGWQDTALWSIKNNSTAYNRGLILVHGLTQAYNTYQVVSATSSTITIQGSFDPAGVNPSLDASFGLIYGQLIRSAINAPTVVDPLTTSERPVTFFDPNRQNSLGGFTDQEQSRQGICQVCHTRTAYWTEDGLNDGHNAATTCTDCHMREQGFKPNGGGHSDGDGTFGWVAACAACHNPSGTETILSSVHKIGNGNSCILCHINESGGNLDPATSAGNTTPGNTPHLCSDCHISPSDQHHATTRAQAGDCGWCHADPRQQWESTYGISGSKPRQLACRECHVKADGTGLVVYKLDYPVTPDDLMTFPGGDLSQPADNAKAVVQTVMDGSNGTTNHGIIGSSKIEIYDFGACFSCHDGTTATRVNVWHARPKYSEIPADTDTDAFRMHFDVLRHAPGRSLFNLWRGDGSQAEPYFSHPDEFYANGGDAETRGFEFFDNQSGRNVIEWNWGATSSAFGMVQIPCFRNGNLGNDVEGLCGENSGAASEQVPVFEDVAADTITITTAEWNPANLGAELLVQASNTIQGAVVQAEYNGTTSPMNWNESSGIYELNIQALSYAPTIRIFSDYYGETTSQVNSLGENFSVIRAQLDNSQPVLTILALNEVGAATTVHALYGPSSFTLANAGHNRWQLVGQPVSSALTTLTLWSEAGGYAEVAVEICATPGYPLPTAGTLSDAGSYWNRTEKDPDRLRVQVHVGTDGGTPTLLLNGSGTDMTYPCTERSTPGVYRCQVEGNTLHSAGYDHWAVVYTGASPGEGSMINYRIDDWSVDQDPLEPLEVSGSGQQACTPLDWDSILNASAFWDGSTLNATAQNDWADLVALQADYDGASQPMEWQSATSQWQTIMSGVPYNSTLRLHSEAGADQTFTVIDLTSQPDTVTITDAGWNSGGNGELTVTANNDFGNQVTLTAHYNTISTPMTWNGQQWQLDNVSGITLPSQVTVTSSAQAGGQDTWFPVEDRTPQYYPPACDANNDWDNIITPLDRAEFDPLDSELHVDVENLVNTSYGARLFMTYSETEDGQTHYELSNEGTAKWEYKETGFSWSPGATVTVWSQDSNDVVMAVECGQPVFNSGLNDTLTISRADWQPTTGNLTVQAENSMADTTMVYLNYGALTLQPMIWNSSSQLWELSLAAVSYNSQVEIYSDANGQDSASVIDLTPDPITIDQAIWRPDTLIVRATNPAGQENQLYVDYNGQSGLAMTWSSSDQNWQLDLSPTAYTSTIRVWSVRPGEASGPVEDMSATHLNVSGEAECAACHTGSDIVFETHLADCQMCHQSSDPVVQNLISSGQGGSCSDCHIPTSGRIQVQEISFNYSGSQAIPLKDHTRPDSDILLPVPEYSVNLRSGPAAFAKDTPITIKVIFQAEVDVTSAMIGSSLFTEQLVTFSNGVSPTMTFSLPPSVSQNPGVSNLAIDWHYCDENGSGNPGYGTPELMHRTYHPLYITHASPVGTAPFYHQLVEWSCLWSQDAQDEQGIVDSIFDGTWILGAQGYRYVMPFLGRTGNNVGDILRQQEGACGEWTAFMLRAIEVQGIDVFYVDISPDDRDNYIVLNQALGTNEDVWMFADHAFLIYGADVSQANDPEAGTVYDPTYHLSGPGWGGYEDVLIRYFEEDDTWYDNPGFGNGPTDDQVNSYIRITIDDWVYVEQ